MTAVDAAATAPEPTVERRGRVRRSPLLGIVVLAGLGVALSGALSGGRDGEAAAEARNTQAVVHGVLRAMRGAWAEQNLDSIVPKSLTPDDARPVLAAILADPDHPWFRQAVLLTMHLGLADLLPSLDAALPVVKEDGTRALLVTAVDQFKPWSDQELARLFAGESAQVVIAALKAAGKRADRPVEEIGELLVASDPGVRAAALEAIPEHLAPAVGERIAAAARQLDAATATEAVLALGRCQGSPVVDEFLYLRLGEPAFCDTVLEALSRRRAPLLRPGRVQEIAADAGQPVGTRARALLCLERTGAATDLGRLEAGNGHPVLDYFAARLLLQARRPAGLQLLLGVVRSEDAGDGDAEAAMVAEARMGARLLLAQLAGTSAGADPAAWESWIQERPALPAVTLPQPAVRLAP